MGQLYLGRQKILLENQRLSLVRAALGKAVFLRQLFANEMVYARIGFPMGQRLGAGGFFRGTIVPQMGNHAAIGPCLGMMRIDLERFIQKNLRFLVAFAIDEMIRHQQPCTNVLGIRFQGRLCVHGHQFAVRWRKGAGGAEMQLGMAGMFLQRLLKGAAGQFEIAFG